jgi:hypothetical protein
VDEKQVNEKYLPIVWVPNFSHFVAATNLPIESVIAPNDNDRRTFILHCNDKYGGRKNPKSSKYFKMLFSMSIPEDIARVLKTIDLSGFDPTEFPLTSRSSDNNGSLSPNCQPFNDPVLRWLLKALKGSSSFFNGEVGDIDTSVALACSSTRTTQNAMPTTQSHPKVSVYADCQSYLTSELMLKAPVDAVFWKALRKILTFTESKSRKGKNKCTHDQLTGACYCPASLHN